MNFTKNISPIRMHLSAPLRNKYKMVMHFEHLCSLRPAESKTL